MREFRAVGEQMRAMALAGQPCVRRASVPICSEVEAFEWLQQAAEGHRLAQDGRTRKKMELVTGRLRSPADHSETGGRRPVFLAYVGKFSDLWPRIPSRADASFPAYMARLREEFASDEFGFQVPQLESASEEAFSRCREIVAPLAETFGQRITRFNSFFGDYRRTPFGIHVDAHHCHAFQYIIHGIKTLRTWDSRALCEAIGEEAFMRLLANPSEHEGPLPGEQTLVAGPGDILYWPGNYTHCLESDGLNFGLGIIVESKSGTLNDRLKLRLTARAEQAVQRASVATRSDWTVDVKGLRRVLKELSEEIDSDDSERELVLDGLSLKTGQASVGTIPLKRDITVAATAVVDSLVPVGSSIESTVYQEAVHVAANGHSATWGIPNANASAEQLIACLRTARALPVAELFARFEQTVEAETIARLVRFLVSAHAVRLTAPVASKQTTAITNGIFEVPLDRDAPADQNTASVCHDGGAGLA